MAFVWVGTGLGRERVGGKAQSDARCSVTRMVYGGPPPATGKYRIKVMQRDRCTVVDVAADQNLRIALMASNIDLYTLGGKLRNCGGNGACGTCIVDIQDGTWSLTPRTLKEESLLKGKPDTWRLACRAQVTGEGLVVATKPQ